MFGDQASCLLQSSHCICDKPKGSAQDEKRRDDCYWLYRITVSMISFSDLKAAILLPLCWSVSTSAVVYNWLPGSGKDELVIEINPSIGTSEERLGARDESRFSCDRWQTIRPLFHPEKLNDGDTLSFRKENTAFATGRFLVAKLFSISPRLINTQKIIVRIHRMES